MRSMCSQAIKYFGAHRVLESRGSGLHTAAALWLALNTRMSHYDQHRQAQDFIISHT